MTKITDSDLLKKMEEALGHDLEVHGINPTYFIGNNDMEVFYTDGKDILVKVLLNEQESAIPVKTDIWPYYHWNEVKEYYQKRLSPLP